MSFGLLPSGPPVNITSPVTATSLPTKTFGINWQTGHIEPWVDGLAAVQQAVGIALGVQRYQWQIYSTNFGSELSTLIGQPDGLVRAEIPRMVQDALSIDDRITGVDSFSLVQNGHAIQVLFTVHTVYGDFSTVQWVNN